MTDIFGHSVRSESLALYLAEAASCFVLIHLLLLGLAAGPDAVDWTGQVTLAAILAAATGLAAGATGFHDPARWTRARRLALGGLLTALLLLPFAWLAVAVLPTPPGGARAGVTIATLAAAGAGAAVLTRILFLGVSRAGIFVRPIAVVAASGAEPLPRTAGGREPFRIALGLDPTASPAPGSLRGRGIRVVVADDPRAIPAPLRATLEREGARILSRTDFLERREGRVDLSSLRPGWLDGARGTRETRTEVAVRRALDIAVASSVLLLTLPLLIAAIVAIRLDSPGPVFYRQDRVGRGGRTFSLLKLRSMRADAEAGAAPRWATQNDPRVTRVGRLLRLTRVDEIPQVINVLRGDMAFIGPRPERPVFVARLTEAIPHYADRAVVKPGITGWAQVCFPYGASVEDARQKLAYDLYYVRRRSLFLDLLILVATARVVLFQEGSR